MSNKRPKDQTVCKACMAAQSGHKLYCLECGGVALVYINADGVASAFIGQAPPAPPAEPAADDQAEEPVSDGPAAA